jgi:hypothetical protein
VLPLEGHLIACRMRLQLIAADRHKAQLSMQQHVIMMS